ncbi:energy-coupling factor transporter transmembrane component T family protein [Aeromicrobium sp. CF4.19]|uniref:energy-coupling factor transporter transmembrane component T family protein n=1 Tax=Aeromicrobium sp. CF4.19 TaxID=3373082 RepID=UPI003EE73E97
MRGWLPRANPLALLVVGMASVPASLAVRSLTVALVTVAVYAVAAFLLVPSVRYVLLCLAFAVFAGLTVAYSTWRLGGHDEVVALTAGLRIVVLAWPGSLLVVLIDPARLGDHLGQNLRLPARPVVAVTASLQQAGELLGVWRELGRTRRARGVAPARGVAARVRHGASMAFALLVASLRSASRRSVALDARGFAQATHRTWAEPAPWTRLDVAVVLGGLALAAVPVTMHFLG